jgi:CelD/BcsL family acetyltransferase involved in cellulose biosynthesis
MSSDLTVEVVDQLAAFETLRDEWDRSVETSVDPNIFLTWDWLRTWWRYFGETNPDATLHVVVVRDADGLVAAAPLFRVAGRAGPLRVAMLRQISFDAGDYGGIVLVRRPDEAVDALLAHIGEQLRGGVGGMVFSRLTDDSVFLDRLRARLAAGASGAGLEASETKLDGACPYADVSGDYDLRRHLKKHKIRQRQRRISEKHAVEFTWHSGLTLDEGLRRFVEVHRERWAGREDDLQGQLADPRREAFLMDAIRALDRQDRLRLLVLTADGQTVGAELDFELCGRVYMFKGAFDPRFAEFSPGQLLTYRAFEDGIERGVVEFDFLRGDHPYKRRWADQERHLVAVTLSRSGAAGRVATARIRALRLVQRVRRSGGVDGEVGVGGGLV